MIQEIMVYLIITGAVAYTAYNFYQIFNPKHTNSKKCAGCIAGSCEISKLGIPKR